MTAVEESGQGALQPTRLSDHVPAQGSVEFVLLLNEEVGTICASEAFSKSPILVKLLRFLTEETVAGRGEKLKSYTVAVDGLGRNADFDAQTDSYPRVQIARLRRMLEAYYERHSAVRGLQVVIPTGSYRVTLERPLASSQPTEAAPPPETLDAPPPTLDARPAAKFGQTRRWQMTALAVGLVLILAGAALYWLRSSDLSVAQPRSAVLFTTPISAGSDPTSRAEAEAFQGKLLDGLSRAWVARTIPVPAQLPAGDSGFAYRLETQFGPVLDGQRSLFVRLLDHRASTVLWSREYRLENGDNEPAATTELVLADLGGSYGVIARAEARRLQDSFDPGYACLLQYFHYLTSRNQSVRDRISACLEQPTAEARLEGMRQGVRAMFALDVPPSNRQQRAAQMRTAIDQAQLAVEAYPGDYYAQFALARLSLAQSDCDTGARHTGLAMAANPNDPLVVGVLSTLTYFCGLPDRLGLADRAFRFVQNGDSSARLTTIMFAIATDRRDRLAILADLPVPRTGDNVAFIHLCNTLLYAALDQPEAARANWASYRKDLGPNRSADDLLAQYIVADLSRERITKYLQGKQIIN